MQLTEAAPENVKTLQENSKPKRTFLTYIHSFRGLAMLFIVGLHTCITTPWSDAVLQRKSMVVLFNNSTVLFIFIAGYLFYHLNKDKFSYGTYLWKKFLYVVLPYLAVSIPALIDKIYFDKLGEYQWLDKTFLDWPVAMKVGYLLVTGNHMGIFWLIPMICILYLLAPVFLTFAKRNGFVFIAPVLVILGMYLHRFGYFANTVLSLQYCLPVYLFGIWIYKIQDHLFANIKTWIIILSAAFVALCLCEFFEIVPFSETIGLREVQYTIYRFNWNKFKMHILAVAALLIFYHWSHIGYRSLKLIGDYSFGIFFVHLYVLQAFRVLDNFNYLPVSPLNLLTFSLYFVVVMSISMAIVWVVKATFKEKSRYLIGS